jgi:hypothetical protein
MYFTRVLDEMPLTTTPDMSWSSLGTIKCAAAVAASKVKLVSVYRSMLTRILETLR